LKIFQLRSAEKNSITNDPTGPGGTVLKILAEFEDFLRKSSLPRGSDEPLGFQSRRCFLKTPMIRREARPTFEMLNAIKREAQKERSSSKISIGNRLFFKVLWDLFGIRRTHTSSSHISGSDEPSRKKEIT
jgi:hypothetical protein